MTHTTPNLFNSIMPSQHQLLNHTHPLELTGEAMTHTLILFDFSIDAPQNESVDIEFI